MINWTKLNYEDVGNNGLPIYDVCPIIYFLLKRRAKLNRLNLRLKCFRK
jgi:hypothetical protein